MYIYEYCPSSADQSLSFRPSAVRFPECYSILSNSLFPIHNLSTSVQPPHVLSQTPLNRGKRSPPTSPLNPDPQPTLHPPPPPPTSPTLPAPIHPPPNNVPLQHLPHHLLHPRIPPPPLLLVRISPPKHRRPEFRSAPLPHLQSDMARVCCWFWKRGLVRCECFDELCGCAAR